MDDGFANRAIGPSRGIYCDAAHFGSVRGGIGIGRNTQPLVLVRLCPQPAWCRSGDLAECFNSATPKTCLRL